MQLYRNPTRALLGIGTLTWLGSAAMPPAQATTIIVTNGDFSMPMTTSNTTSDSATSQTDVPGWTVAPPVSPATTGFYGVLLNSTVGINGPAGGGSQSLYLDTATEAYQNVLMGPLQTGFAYTLTGDALGRGNGANNAETFSLYTEGAGGAPGTLLASQSYLPSAGSFDPATVTYLANGTESGLDIVLSHNYVPGLQGEFGNIALDASAAPEPSQVGMLALIGLGLSGLLLRARKRQSPVA